jgi:hypothetical protein
MKIVTLIKPLTLARDDGRMAFYPAGTQAVADEDADHWYVKAHMAAEPPPGPGDELYARALRTSADAKRADADKVEAEAVEAERAWEKRRDDLAAKGKADESQPPESDAGATTRQREAAQAAIGEAGNKGQPTIEQHDAARNAQERTRIRRP